MYWIGGGLIALVCLFILRRLIGLGLRGGIWLIKLALQASVAAAIAYLLFSMSFGG